MAWGVDIPPTSSPTYEWDTWRAKDYVLVDVSDLPPECLDISTSARMAFTNAIAEIVLTHLESFDRNGDLRAAIEAGWAFISPDYEVEFALPDQPDERGPGAEPVRISVTILFDMIRGEGGSDRCFPLAWMDALARHVLEDSPVYDGWFDGALERLVEYHPEPEVDIFAHRFPVGAPVDLNLFDLRQVYTFDASAPDLRRYLAAIAPENPDISPK